MNDFAYHVAQSMAEVGTFLAEAVTQGKEARLLAGGTVLIPYLKEGVARPALVIDLKHIPELKTIRLDDTGLHLGPLVTPTELIRSYIIQEHYPVLAQAAGTMAGVQIRNMATVGGNVCNAAPTADLIPSLVTLGGLIQIRGPQESRSVPIEQFCTGPGQTILAPDEWVTEITIPRPAAAARAIYIKHALRQAMAIAIVGVGVAVRGPPGTCEEARIALGGVAPTPLRAVRAEAALRGQSLNANTIAAAAHLAAEESQPDDDVRASAWYRRRMVEVLTRRALQALGTKA